MAISDIVRRLWRGAWKPVFNPPWAYLDPQPLFVVLVVFLSPIWVALAAYMFLASDPKLALMVLVLSALLWAPLTLIAYAGGRTANPVDPRLVGSNVIIWAAIFAILAWRGT